MIYRELFELVANVLSLPADKITLQSGPSELAQWDSLAHVTICAAVEHSYKIQFTMPEMLSIKSLEDIVSLIEAHGASVANEK